MTFAESFVAIGEKKGLDRTRQAIELLDKNTSIEEVACLTGLSIDMVRFLAHHIHR